MTNPSPSPEAPKPGAIVLAANVLAAQVATGTRKDSGYARDVDDWYVEDVACVRTLFRAMPWFAANSAHDPCCGGGNIPRVAASCGVSMTGSDKIDRANGQFPVQDFLADHTLYPGIVSNPPFQIAEKIIRHALHVTHGGGYVAIIAQAKFLFSQGRHPLFTMPEFDRALILSRRPSMPPGHLLAEKGESIRGGGFLDFLWLVWRIGKVSRGAAIEWLL